MALSRQLSLAALLALVVAARSAEARDGLVPRLAQLMRYDVIRSSEPAGDGLLRHRAQGVFDAAPEDVFRVVTSYGTYSEYMPRILDSRVAWQGTDAIVALTADMPWPMPNLWVEARFQHDSPALDRYRVRFSLIRGNVLRYEGSLFIEPCPMDESKSLVTYELVTQLDTGLPRGWLQGMVGRGVYNFVHYVRGRVNLLQRQGVLHNLPFALLGAVPTRTSAVATAAPPLVQGAALEPEVGREARAAVIDLP